jgi:hypothetical protein
VVNKSFSSRKMKRETEALAKDTGIVPGHFGLDQDETLEGVSGRLRGLSCDCQRDYYLQSSRATCLDARSRATGG